MEKDAARAQANDNFGLQKRITADVDEFVSQKSNVNCTKIDICDMKGSSFIPDELRIKIGRLLRDKKVKNHPKT